MTGSLRLSHSAAAPLKYALYNVAQQVDECKLRIRQDGLKIRAVDPANVALVDLWLSAGDFDSFDAETGVVGLPVEDVADAVGPVNMTEAVTLTVKSGKVGIEGDDVDESFKLIDPDSVRQEPDLPELDLPVTATVNGDDLKRLVYFVRRHSGDHLRFGTNDDGLFAYSTHDIGDFYATPDATVRGEGADSLFSVDYLRDFTAKLPQPKSTSVTLRLGDEFPLYLSWDVPQTDNSEFTGMLAPRIQSDDSSPAAGAGGKRKFALEREDLRLSADTKTMRKVLEPLNTLVDECRLHVTGDALEVAAVDPANVGMVMQRTGFSAFESVDINDDVWPNVVGMNTRNPNKMMPRFRADETLTLRLDQSTRMLELSNEWMHYSGGLIDPDSVRQEPDFPAMDHSDEATVPIGEFFGPFPKDDHINLGVVEDTTWALSASDGEDELTTWPDTGQGVGWGFYSAKYLHEIQTVTVPNDTPLTVRQSYFVGDDEEGDGQDGTTGPVVLDYDLFDGDQQTRYLLAPRLSDTDDRFNENIERLQAAGLDTADLDRWKDGEADVLGEIEPLLGELPDPSDYDTDEPEPEPEPEPEDEEEPEPEPEEDVDIPMEVLGWEYVNDWGDQVAWQRRVYGGDEVPGDGREATMFAVEDGDEWNLLVKYLDKDGKEVGTEELDRQPTKADAVEAATLYMEGRPKPEEGVEPDDVPDDVGAFSLHNASPPGVWVWSTQSGPHERVTAHLVPEANAGWEAAVEGQEPIVEDATEREAVTAAVWWMEDYEPPAEEGDETDESPDNLDDVTDWDRTPEDGGRTPRYTKELEKFQAKLGYRLKVNLAPEDDGDTWRFWMSKAGGRRGAGKVSATELGGLSEDEAAEIATDAFDERLSEKWGDRLEEYADWKGRTKRQHLVDNPDDLRRQKPGIHRKLQQGADLSGWVETGKHDDITWPDGKSEDQKDRDRRAQENEEKRKRKAEERRAARLADQGLVEIHSHKFDEEPDHEWTFDGGTDGERRWVIRHDDRENEWLRIVRFAAGTWGVKYSSEGTADFHPVQGYDTNTDARRAAHRLLDAYPEGVPEDEVDDFTDKLASASAAYSEGIDKKHLNQQSKARMEVTAEYVAANTNVPEDVAFAAAYRNAAMTPRALRDIANDRPERVRDVKGIGRRRLREIQQLKLPDPDEDEEADLIEVMKDQGLTGAQAVALAGEFDGSISALKQAVTSHTDRVLSVHGIGEKTLDTLRPWAGIPSKEERLEAQEEARKEKLEQRRQEQAAEEEETMAEAEKLADLSGIPVEVAHRALDRYRDAGHVITQAHVNPESVEEIDGIGASRRQDIADALEQFDPLMWAATTGELPSDGNFQGVIREIRDYVGRHYTADAVESLLKYQPDVILLAERTRESPHTVKDAEGLGEKAVEDFEKWARDPVAVYEAAFEGFQVTQPVEIENVPESAGYDADAYSFRPLLDEQTSDEPIRVDWRDWQDDDAPAPDPPEDPEPEREPEQRDESLTQEPPESLGEAMGYDRVVLVGCGKQKADEKVPAKDLYTSWYFQRKRAYAEQEGGEWAILSAKHGLLDPDRAIEPYDLGISNLDAETCQEWGEHVVKGIRNTWGEGIEVVLLAGQDYRGPLLDAGLDSAVSSVHSPFDATGGIGEQVEWLNEHIGKEAKPEATAPEVAAEKKSGASDTTMLANADIDETAEQMERYGFEAVKVNTDKEVVFEPAVESRGRKTLRAKRQDGEWVVTRGGKREGSYDSLQRALKKVRVEASRSGRTRALGPQRRADAAAAVVEESPVDVTLKSSDELTESERQKIREGEMPGYVYGVTRKLWKGYQIGVNQYEDTGDEQELERARMYAGIINAINELFGEGTVHFKRLQDDLGYDPIPMEPPVYIEDDAKEAGVATSGGRSIAAAPMDPTTNFDAAPDESGLDDWKEAIAGGFLEERERSSRASLDDTDDDSDSYVEAYRRDIRRKREADWESAYEQESRGEPEFNPLWPLTGTLKERNEQVRARKERGPDIQQNRRDIESLTQEQFTERRGLKDEPLTDIEPPSFDESGWEAAYEDTEEAQERSREDKRRETLASFDPTKGLYDPMEDVESDGGFIFRDDDTGGFIFGD